MYFDKIIRSFIFLLKIKINLITQLLNPTNLRG
jgi:hypothetical protein